MIDPPESEPIATIDSSTAFAWTTIGDIPRVVFSRQALARTVTVALIVGSILFTINQLDVVLSGKATGVVWFKVGLTYVVPFCVSNYGILSATHRRKVS